MGLFIRHLWLRHKTSGRNIRQRMESVLPTAGLVNPRGVVPLATRSRVTTGSIAASPTFRPSSAKLGPTGGSH